MVKNGQKRDGTGVKNELNNLNGNVIGFFLITDSWYFLVLTIVFFDMSAFFRVVHISLKKKEKSKSAGHCLEPCLGLPCMLLLPIC